MYDWSNKLWGVMKDKGVSTYMLREKCSIDSKTIRRLKANMNMERQMLKKQFTKKDKRTNLEKEIDRVIEQMSSTEPNTDEYKAISENLEKLYKAKAHERIRNVSPDTIAVIAGNLLGIGLILGYEKANVITTKALGFVMKGRV